MDFDSIYKDKKNEKNELIEYLKQNSYRGDIGSTLDRIAEIEKELNDLDIQSNINNDIVNALETLYKVDFKDVNKNVVLEIVKVNKICKKMGGELTSKQVIANIVCRVDAYTKF